MPDERVTLPPDVSRVAGVPGNPRAAPLARRRALACGQRSCGATGSHYNRATMNDRAVFLDRDGVLMRDSNYVGHVDRVEIIAGAPRALRRLREAGFRLFVVTNQSGVGRGYFTREAVEEIHALLDSHFGKVIDRYYVCPHHP